MSKIQEIEDKIKELVSDKSNFISDNYGSEGADNGEYEVFFSEYSTQNTLEQFAKWLLS